MSDCAERMKKSVYLEDRRTIFGYGFLKPTERITQIILYCLGWAAQEHGVVIHGISCVMNRLVYIVSDPNSVMGQVTEWAHKFIAIKVNEELERKGTVFAPDEEHTSIIRCAKAGLEQLIRLLLLPVTARLVRRPEWWKGIWFGPEMLAGGTVRIENPGFVGKKFPRYVEITLEPLPGFEREGYVELVSEELERVLKLVHGVAREEGWLFLGWKRAFKRRVELALGVEYERVERFVVEEGDVAAWERAWERDRAFVKAQREARRRYVRGEREVEFPAGTYWMRVQFWVRCGESRDCWYP